MISLDEKGGLLLVTSILEVHTGKLDLGVSTSGTGSSSLSLCM